MSEEPLLECLTRALKYTASRWQIILMSFTNTPLADFTKEFYNQMICQRRMYIL